MSELDRKYFQEIINGKKFLSREGKKRAYTRIDDILHLTNEVKKHEYIMHNHTDLPRIEFMGAIEKFLSGFFYESLQNSVNSVDLGLLVALTEKLPDPKKQEIHKKINTDSYKDSISFTFGKMKQIAIESRIIKGKQAIKLFDYINEVRNTLYHPVNLMNLLLTQQQVAIPEFEKFIKRFEQKKNRKIFKLLKLLKILPKIDVLSNLAEYGKNTLENTDSFEWCTKKDANLRVRKEISDYVENTMREGEILGRKIEETPLNALELINYAKNIHNKGIMHKLSLNMINNSFEALNHLNFY